MNSPMKQKQTQRTDWSGSLRLADANNYIYTYIYIYIYIYITESLYTRN